MGTALVAGAAGAAAQFVDGLLGMGYGVSASTLLLALGVAPAIVSATVHAAKVPSGLVSGVAHLREGNVDGRIAGPLAAGGAAGAVLGATLLARVAAAGVRPVVAAVLLLLGARMVACHLRSRRPQAASRRLTAPHLAVLGFVGGALDAFGGGGWGPTTTCVLMSSDGRQPRRLVGSVSMAEVAPAVSTLVTLAFTLGGEPFAWSYVLPLVAGGIVAAPVAARLCARVSPRTLGVAVGAVLVALNALPLSDGIGRLPLPALRASAWAVTGLALAAVTYSALRGSRPASQAVA